MQSDIVFLKRSITVLHMTHLVRVRLSHPDRRSDEFPFTQLSHLSFCQSTRADGCMTVGRADEADAHLLKFLSI